MVRILQNTEGKGKTVWSGFYLKNNIVTNDDRNNILLTIGPVFFLLEMVGAVLGTQLEIDVAQWAVKAYFPKIQKEW